MTTQTTGAGVPVEGGRVDAKSTLGPLPPGTVPLTEGDPAKIGEYCLLARLSSGFGAPAYLVRSGPAAPLAVLKTASPRPAGGNRLRRNFVDVSGVRMPSAYVANVMGRGSYEGTAYLVREYVDGMTLAQLVTEDGSLDPTTLNAVAVSTAAAIAAVHGAGQVHGNLKPTNVMVTLAGVRLLDHGLGRRSGQPRQQPSEDVLGWARLVAFAGTGRSTAAMAAESLLGVGVLAKPIAPLVARALVPDARMRPSAKELLLCLVSAPESAASGQRWGIRRQSRGVALPV